MNTNEIAELFHQNNWKNWEKIDEGYFIKYERPRILTVKQTQWLKDQFVRETEYKDRSKAEIERSIMGQINETTFWNVNILKNGCGIMTISNRNQTN